MYRDLDGVGFVKNVGIPMDLSRLFANPSIRKRSVQIERKIVQLRFRSGDRKFADTVNAMVGGW